MLSRQYLFRAALLSSAIVAPTLAWAESATPSCADLATDPAWGLAGNPSITGPTAVVTPPSGSNLAYCQVNFTDVTLVGPEFGYLPGQTSKIRIRVGLPLNAIDGGSGGVQGAWNGKIRTLGNGGFAGQVVSVTASTNLGYIGSSSDSGHNSSITNPAPWPGGPFPTTQLPPSESGAVFALNPDNTVNYGRIMDYAYRGVHHANLWAAKIGKTYYGMKHTRNYFTGCSDGGREAHELAGRYGQKFDGILAFSPAVGHTLQQQVAGWANYMTNQELGTPGFNTAKFQDVNARAKAACDALDGITDGMLDEPRACTYNANSAICGQPGASADPTVCLTPTEASIVNRIWDGPRNPNGSTYWYGWQRGQGGAFAVTPDIPGVGGPQLFGEQLWRYWLHRDPFKDWRTVSEAQFLVETHNLTQQFTPWLSGDHTDFKPFKKQGGKLITTFGKNDQVIIPDGFTHYVNRVIKANGGPAKTREFYRFFHFPEALHCGGAGMSMEPLFATLVNWVENGVAPDHVVAQVNPTRTRKVCVYPNTAVYNGTGSTDDEANFHCQTRTQDPYFETASEHTAGPKKGNNDIGNLPD